MHIEHMSKGLDDGEKAHNPCGKAMTLAKHMCWQRRDINLKNWGSNTKRRI